MNMGCGASRGTLKSGGIASNEALRYSSPPSCWINSLPYCDIWSNSGLGKKQGVSESWNLTGVPQRSSINFRNAWYLAGVKLALNRCRRAGIMILYRCHLEQSRAWHCMTGHPERSSWFAKRISYAVEGPLLAQLRRCCFEVFFLQIRRSNSLKRNCQLNPRLVLRLGRFIRERNPLRSGWPNFLRFQQKLPIPHNLFAV